MMSLNIARQGQSRVLIPQLYSQAWDFTIPRDTSVTQQGGKRGSPPLPHLLSPVGLQIFKHTASLKEFY